MQLSVFPRVKPVAIAPSVGLGATANAGTWLLDNRFMPTPIPEPGTRALMAGGLMAVGALARRRRVAA